jgi:hypothetical protein
MSIKTQVFLPSRDRPVNMTETIFVAVRYAVISQPAGSPMHTCDENGNAAMRRYSITRDGNDFIVQVDAIGVLRCSSRQQAVKAISDAIALLQQRDAAPQSEGSTSSEIEQINYPWARTT